MNRAHEPIASPAAYFALIALAAMCILPALVGVHVLPLPSFYEEWLAAALGSIGFAAALYAARHRTLIAPPTLLPLFGLLLVLALQVGLDRLAYHQQAMLAALYVIYAMALAWCGAQLRELAGVERVARFIAYGLCIGGALSALLALVQAYAPDTSISAYVSRLSGPRVYGNLNQANLFGDQLALGGAALLYLHAKRHIRALPALLLGLLLAAGMTLSGSRTVWFYLIALLGWTGYLAWRTRGLSYRTLLTQLVGVAVVLVLLAWVLPPMHGRAPDATATVVDRLATLNIEAGRTGGSSDGLRLYFWQQAWQMFSNAPILGVGFGQYAWGFVEQSPLYAALGWTGHERHAHNLLLHLLAETGLLGTLSVIGALLWWAWRLVRAAPSLENWWIAASVGIVFTHNMLEYPLWYAHFLGPFALLYGLGEARPTVFRRHRLGLLSLSGVVLVAALMLGSLLHGVNELRRWVYLVPEAALRDPAIVTKQQQVIARLQGTLLAPYVDLPLVNTVTVNGDKLEAKLAFNGRVMHFAPIAPVMYRQIVFLTLADRHTEARHLLERAAVLYPDQLPAFEADINRLAQAGLSVLALRPQVAELRPAAAP